MKRRIRRRYGTFRRSDVGLYIGAHSTAVQQNLSIRPLFVPRKLHTSRELVRLKLISPDVVSSLWLEVVRNVSRRHPELTLIHYRTLEGTVDTEILNGNCLI